MIEGPTQALREKSPELLRSNLLNTLVAYGAAKSTPDSRDVLWSLAPYHDCSRQIDLDPIALFDEVADAGPPQLRQLVRHFGRRTDISPEAFGGYALIDTPGGSSYVWT